MFNNKIKFALTALVSAIALSACQPKQAETKDESAQVQQEQNAPKLEGKLEKLSLNLPKCEDQYCPEISIERLNSNQSFIDEAIDQQIIQVLNQILDPEMLEGSMAQPEAAVSEVNKEKIETAKQKLERQLIPFTQNFLALDQEVKALHANHQISLMIKPKILNSQGPLATVVLNGSNYLGGAHGSTLQQYFNFDLESKKYVPLKDIVEKNKWSVLDEKAYEAFKTWVFESGLSTDIKEYEQTWKFKLTDHYYLGTKGLILQYGEYEIGPYSIGLPRLTIPYDQLQGILKAKYLPAAAVKTQNATSEAHPSK